MTTKQVREVRADARIIGAAVAWFLFDGGRCSPVLEQAIRRCRAWLVPYSGYKNFRRVDYHQVSHVVALTFCDLDSVGVVYG